MEQNNAETFIRNDFLILEADCITSTQWHERGLSLSHGKSKSLSVTFPKFLYNVLCLTWKEIFGLGMLAENANAGTREC